MDARRISGCLYRLLACDGSDINIFRNPADHSTYYCNSESDKGFNELHIDPNIGEFDRSFSMNLVRSRKAIDKNNPTAYKLLSSHSTFDFIAPGQTGVFPIAFRAVRFLIDNSMYEVILTNLDAKDFPAKIIKQLYAMRWGIETSFRELKHTLALNKFPARLAKVKMSHYLSFQSFKIVSAITCAASLVPSILGWQPSAAYRSTLWALSKNTFPTSAISASFCSAT